MRVYVERLKNKIHARACTHGTSANRLQLRQPRQVVECAIGNRCDVVEIQLSVRVILCQRDIHEDEGKCFFFSQRHSTYKSHKLLESPENAPGAMDVIWLENKCLWDGGMRLTIVCKNNPNTHTKIILKMRINLTVSSRQTDC